MQLKKQFIRTAAAWIFLAAFMVLFRPDRLPVVVLIVPFILLFAGFYSTWVLLSSLRSRFITKTDVVVPRRRLGLALCLSVVLLIVLQSLGQLTLKDVITLLAIVFIGYLFLSRNRIDNARQ